jgi:hypothetical protein
MIRNFWDELDNVLLGPVEYGSIDDFGFSDDEIVNLYFSFGGNRRPVNADCTGVSAVEAVARWMVMEWLMPANDPNQSTLF